MERQCPICNRKTGEDDPLCAYHQRSYLNLREKYDRWKAAMDISWEDYLREVARNPNTGEWVREVAQHLLKGERASEFRRPPS